MNAPVLTEAAPVVGVPEWRRVLPPLAGGLLLLGAIFHQEVAAAVQTWNASTAYNHCFLIIPIVLYMLWDRRDELTGLRAQAKPSALVLGIPIALTWLAAERLGIMEGRQLAAVSFAELLLFAVLGPRLWRAMTGPLLYLYFLVPFGEFLTPRLQDITTWFIRQGVALAGIPAYIDGYIIEIPQGTFFVAEACAGLRFLIASIAFGCLYAVLMYRSPVRRAVFIAVSVVVPIIANGIRGFGIVGLGYLLGSAQAAAADHIIYGWLFFSVVILILIALGLPFRQDHRPATRRILASEEEGRLAPMFAASACAVVLALAAPAVSAGLTLAAKGDAPAAPPLADGCTAVTPVADNPALPGGHKQRVACDGQMLDLAWQAFPPRVTAGPVMAARRRLVQPALTESLQEHWLEPGSPWRIMSSGEPSYVTAVSVWVEGAAVRPGLGMRMRQALNSLAGSRYSPMVMTVTPVEDWAQLGPTQLTEADDRLSSFLKAHPELVHGVAEASALR